MNDDENPDLITELAKIQATQIRMLQELALYRSGLETFFDVFVSLEVKREGKETEVVREFCATLKKNRAHAVDELHRWLVEKEMVVEPPADDVKFWDRPSGPQTGEAS